MPDLKACLIPSRAAIAPESLRTIQLSRGFLHVALQGNFLDLAHAERAFLLDLCALLDRGPTVEWTPIDPEVS